MQELKQSIFIGGYSCRLPESNNPEEFWEHLLKGHDLVSSDDRRWTAENYSAPARFGKLKDIEHFDAQFFGVHALQAQKMDPQLRLLLEVSYEAILDAGFSPEGLKGQKTGVFVGSCYSDADKNYNYDLENLTGYENTGCAASMFSNRLSYSFDFNGPSLTVDTACSSSLVAFDMAVKALDSGECDHALVCGTSMILNPAISIGFNKLQMLSADGKCRSFDHKANGYVRAEGIVAVFLSRAGMARKNIAEVLASGINNDGFTSTGITYPNGNRQMELLQGLYGNNDIDIADVSYVEAHGTGTRVGDPEELNALDRVLGQVRTAQTPLLIGSVKSNMGHAEGAAGLAGMVKVLLVIEKGKLPPNLHFDEPNEDIPALLEGRFKVVSETTDWSGGIVGLSSFGFGGTNAHVILRGQPQLKIIDNSINEANIHSLIPISSRTLVGLERNIEYVKEHALHAETAEFYRSIANVESKRQACRGFILTTKTGDLLSEHSEPGRQRRPIWFVYSGQGAQWGQMAADLLDEGYRINSFRRTIEKCHAALGNEGLDLLALIEQANEQSYDDPVHSFVALTAIQLALTDVLSKAGIRPDGILGHSFGEIACGYADAVLTIEQAMQAAYWRGKSIKACVKKQQGQMAVIAMSWAQLCEVCPEGIVLACNNARNNVTVSGERAAVQLFVRQLTEKGIDARLINTSGVAFHSPLIEAAYPVFKQALQQVIPEPLARSERWLSTSISGSETSVTRLCDADYLANNMIKPVLFHEAVSQIPEDAIVIEIAAHTLLHAVLRESLPDALLIGLMRRDKDNQSELLCGLGRCYNSGVDIDWNTLFPMHYPLKSNIRIPGLVSWDHSSRWEVPSAPRKIENRFIIDLSSDEHSYLQDHKLNAQTLYPATAYVYLAWQTIARYHQRPVSKCPIQFENIKFHRATFLDEQSSVELVVRYLPSSTSFEISENESLVATGKARIDDTTHRKEECDFSEEVDIKDQSLCLQKTDFYKELRLGGYDYGTQFQLIEQISTETGNATLSWNGNWITHLDSLLQTCLLTGSRQTFVPTGIGRLAIFPDRQSNASVSVRGGTYSNSVYSRAVEIEQIQVLALAQKDEKCDPIILKYEFVPNHEVLTEDKDWKTAATYTKVLNAYVSRRYFDFIDSTLVQSQPDRVGTGIMTDLLKKSSLIDVNDAQIDQMMTHPGALALRLARYIYDQPEQLCTDAAGLIMSSDEYAKLFDSDLISAQLLERPWLRNCLDIVYENKVAQKPLLIGEVGTGTGSISRQLVSMLRSQEDRYIVLTPPTSYLSQPATVPRFARVRDYRHWNITQAFVGAEQGHLDLVIASNIVHACNNIRLALRNIHDTLCDGGFFLLHEVTHGFPWWLGIWGNIPELWNIAEPEDRSNGFLLSKDSWHAILQEEGFEVVCSKDDGIGFTLFLLRKVGHKDNAFITFCGNKLDTSLTALQQGLEKSAHKPGSRLWLEAELSTSPGLPGLVNCIRREPQGDVLKAVYLDGKDSLTSREREQLVAQDLAVNVFSNGNWGTYRHSPIGHSACRPVQHAQVGLEKTGDLSSFYWQAKPQKASGKLTIKVCYSALNFKDVMLASGKLPKEISDSTNRGIGFEFSGTTEDGNRVMGIADDALATDIQYDTSDGVIWNVPVHWSLADAATVPVVYATAYLALIYSARLEQGQSILIHSGSGGVGQAAIRIALSMECEIFTTVGNNEKKDYLLKAFPALQADHIGSSRTLQFESLILEKTANRGVDVVLNSLAEEKLHASLRLVAEHGHFVEIGRYDMTIDQPVGMRHFLKGITLHGIQLDSIMQHKPVIFREIHRLITDGIEQGVVQPLDRTIFNMDQVEEAFRYMTQGRHKGKVLIQIRDEENECELQVNAKTAFYASSEKTYLITGGLGGVGLELVNWLIERGAKYFVLSSRHGVKSDYQSWQLSKWKKQGVHVEISSLDVSVEAQAQELIDQISTEHGLAGIFHLAMVLSDALFSNQNVEQFIKVVQPKLGGAKNLDKLSREKCPELEHFVVFSSLSGALGNVGQSNYAYANSALDNLCEIRKAQGYSALSVQWGIIGDVGVAEELLNNEDTAARMLLINLQMEKQSIRSVMATLGELLMQEHPVVASYVPYRDIIESSDMKSRTKKTSEELKLMILKILGAKDVAEDFINIPFSEMGLDSLMGVEIYQKLDRDFDIRLTIPEMMDVTIQKLMQQFDSQARSIDVSVEGNL
jgi:fatty acid synthase, animal type